MSEDVKEELKQRLARAVLAMQKMQARIDTLERARTEPIAIVGMGCRFPGGADTPEAFWELLREGRDAIRREPASRRQGPDTGAPRWGGYLEDVSGFDAAFFGISPREATSLDPRQRLLLEVAWEALEHAGQDPERLADTPTGVFVGLTGDDYARLLPTGPERIDAYFATGNGHCFPPGRVSYSLGLRGPSLAVDTACSSSLVTVHLACQSLRQGECDLALAGGVNLVLDPAVTETLVRMQALSPNGRCSAFDARANGFVRGEGCGLVVLKRLSDARAHGDTLLAVIRGSAVNQDGRSQGLTAPNGLAQRALLRQALASAKVEPSALGYVEAHGTGTPLGDPIEVEALREVLGGPRPEGSRCALGSVKTNLGHLEAAAGIAGLMKTVLALQHGAIPRHLHFSRLNPRIHLEDSPLFVPLDAHPWPRSGVPRLAGVSAFGMSGTNAHVILEEAPLAAPPQRPPAPRSPHLLTLCARSPEALESLARRHAAHLTAHPELDAADVCFTANTTRSRMAHRLAVVGGSTQSLATGLAAFAAGERPETVARGREGTQPPRVAFLFTGQGSQFAGMGRGLYESSPVFREALERCAARLRPRMELLSVLYPADGAPSPIDQTEYSQPALFALEYALAEQWRAWGVVPDAVMGHSVGEFAAACVAGLLSLEDALELIAERGRLMQALPPGGLMATVFAPESQVAPLLEPHRAHVSIAAYNAPGHLTLSGETGAVEHLLAALEAQGVATRRLNVSHAFHSPRVEPMLAGLEARAAGMKRMPGRVPLISNVTGRPVGPDELGAPGYWSRHAREAVRFQQGMASLRALGIDTFLELGPHTTLLGLGKACGVEEGLGWFSSLRKGREDSARMLGVLGQLFVRGHALDWRKVDAEPARRRLVLPRYPWQRQRYWALEGGGAVTKPAPAETERPREEGAEKGALYGLEWRPLARPAASPARAWGTWLVLCDDGGVGEALAARIEAQGLACVKVAAGDATALARVWSERFSAETPCAGVVDLGGLDVAGAEGPDVREACLTVASVVRLLEAAPERGGRLWVVTRNAQAVSPGTPVNPAQAVLWGLGRTVALESPGHWGGLIDLGSRDGAERLWEELRTAGAEDQVALRGSERSVARLVEGKAPASRPLRVEAEATYLLTGGQGSLGLEVARGLVRRGARHLVLTARGDFPERERWDALVAEGGAQAERIARVRELEAAGAKVLLARADVTRRDELAALLERLRAELPPLKGVVHAAAVSASARVSELEAEGLGRVLAPKVEGAWNLHVLTQAEPLDFFILFSSVSAVWGLSRGGAYAAGNAFLDALAAHRQARGLPASSLGWGLWSGGGLATDEERRWLESLGMHALEREAALEWMERLVGAHVSQALVVSVDWARFRPLLEARGPRPLLELLRTESPPAPPQKPRTATPWRDASSAPARREALRTLVQESVSRTLGLPPGEPLDTERGFTELGMDSIMAVELKGRLQEALGLPLPATLAFNFPSVRTLTEHLASKVEAEAPRSAGQPREESAVDEPIAIVGMACRLPGGVDTPEAFWELLREGRDAISEIPAERWDVDGWYDARPEAPGRMSVRSGGFLREVDRFEPRFFGISPREAESMDPQQRLVLEVAWEALERAGQDARALRDSPTGVFVGVSTADYARVILQGRVEDVDAWFASGTSLNVVAGRLSYTLGLKGPSLAVDTACSSSLTALHLACQSLRSGESTRALAAGVNVILSPESMVAGSKARMLSPDGRCKTFDAAANGFARAEGCGVLVLERLSDARARGADILAVIRGTAVNQDGASSGLTVPNGRAQQEVIGRALRRAGVAPAEVSYLEAHGTGTSLGDPIEAEAMWSVLKEGRTGGESLWMGSVKTNVGHLESAAGVTGVMKVVLAMRHGELPAHLHLKTPNPHIDWKGMGVKVPVALTPWAPTQGRRIAGVSSFGFSGTNAHVVLEEAPHEPSRTGAVERPGHVLVLSARSAAALRTQAGRYARALESETALGDVCFTAATGRVPFEHRLAVVTDAAARLQALLSDVAAGQTPEAVLWGRAVGEAPPVTLVFAGEGACSGDLGRALFETQPVFREALERCGEALREVLPQPLLQVLYGTASSLLMKEEACGRAATFALEWALARLWRAWGVVPRAFQGHGVGALVAEVERGGLELEEGLRRAVTEVPAPSRPGAPADGRPGGVVLTVGPDEAEWSRLLKAVGTLYVRGVEVDWAAFDAPHARRRKTLPTYPFERQRYWWRSERTPAPRADRELRPLALESSVYETKYGPAGPAHLDDHRLFGTVVAAGSSHVALVLSAVEDAHGSPACTLEDLAFPRALVLADDEERSLRVRLPPGKEGGAFEVESLGGPPGEGTWGVHASGSVRVGPPEPSAPWASREALEARCRERLLGADLYRDMDAKGYTLGAGYQWIRTVARGGQDLLGELTLPPLPDRREEHVLHPGLLDSCFQVLTSWTLELQAKRPEGLLVPFSIARFTVYRRPGEAVWCHARVQEGGAEAGEVIGGDLRLYDEEGLVAEVLGFRARMASREAIRPDAPSRKEGARYEVHWRPEPLLPRAERQESRPWVLLTDAGGVGERLGGLLEARGARVIHARPGGAFQRLDARTFELDARCPEDFARLLDEALGPEGCAGVVHLWGLDQVVAEDVSAESLQRSVLDASEGVLHLVKALAGRTPAVPLWLVTRGAQAVDETSGTLALAQAPLWGLGRVVDLEHGALRGARVDLDPGALEDSLQLLLAELEAGAGTAGTEVAFRKGVRLLPVLREGATSRAEGPSLREDATYLVTGGLGGLGLEVARWMVERGARHLVLVGRRAPSASAATSIQALERAGARVTVAAVDVSREEDVARLLAGLDESAPPLRGLVHAAGVLDDGALVQQDRERFERVLSPKVAGAWNLHRLTRGRPLDFFALFSSASGLLGSAGQGNYAAANAFLDALAHERRGRGLVAQSLDWGPWAETGMAGGAEGALARTFERRGVNPLPIERSLALLGEALASGRPQVALLSMRWAVYLEALGERGRSTFYEAVTPARRTKRPVAVGPSPARHLMAERLREALPQEREHVLAASLQEAVARVLRLEPGGLDWRQGFAELGMDSLMAIELRDVLQKGLGVSVPATVALDHPTIDFLVKHLLKDVLKLEAPRAREAVEQEALDSLSDDELARLVAEDLARDT